MGTLSVFNFATLNGFYKGVGEDISWHRHGEEEGKFSAESSSHGAVLLFGRKTYEMMKSFWPTPDAAKAMPVVAKNMNEAEKIVFSRTLKTSDWQGTRVVSGKIEDEVRKLKQAGKTMTVLGSGSIVAQLADAGLIDTYQFMIDPVAIGEGTPMFNGLKKKLDLKLTSTRTFKSGVVLLSYTNLLT